MDLRSYWVEGIIFAAILVGLGLGIAAQNKQTGPKISQSNLVEIRTTFERALMYSLNQTRRQDELCNKDSECSSYRDNSRKVAGEWNQLVDRVVKEEKLPPGTGFNVDTSTGTVNVVVPQSKVNK